MCKLCFITINYSNCTSCKRLASDIMTARMSSNDQRCLYWHIPAVSRPFYQLHPSYIACLKYPNLPEISQPSWRNLPILLPGCIWSPPGRSTCRNRSCTHSLGIPLIMQHWKKKIYLAKCFRYLGGPSPQWFYTRISKTKFICEKKKKSFRTP